jgi:hypothetical protein
MEGQEAAKVEQNTEPSTREKRADEITIHRWNGVDHNVIGLNAEYPNLGPRHQDASVLPNNRAAGLLIREARRRLDCLFSDRHIGCAASTGLMQRQRVPALHNQTVSSVQRTQNNARRSVRATHTQYFVRLTARDVVKIVCRRTKGNVTPLGEIVRSRERSDVTVLRDFRGSVLFVWAYVHGRFK